MGGTVTGCESYANHLAVLGPAGREMVVGTSCSTTSNPNVAKCATFVWATVWTGEDSDMVLFSWGSLVFNPSTTIRDAAFVSNPFFRINLQGPVFLLCRPVRIAGSMATIH